MDLITDSFEELMMDACLGCSRLNSYAMAMKQP